MDAFCGQKKGVFTRLGNCPQQINKGLVVLLLLPPLEAGIFIHMGHAKALGISHPRRRLIYFWKNRSRCIQANFWFLCMASCQNANQPVIKNLTRELLGLGIALSDTPSWILLPIYMFIVWMPPLLPPPGQKQVPLW